LKIPVYAKYMFETRRRHLKAEYAEVCKYLLYFYLQNDLSVCEKYNILANLRWFYIQKQHGVKLDAE